jgi:capsular polysaccharide biosynthesis protein
MSRAVLERCAHVLRHPYALLPGAPGGIINSARDWVRARQAAVPSDIRRGPPAAVWEVDPPGMRSLPAPRAAAGAPQAARMLPVSGTALYMIRGARILGEAGVAISPDNRVFAEFTYVDAPDGIGTHSVFRRRRFPPAKPLAGCYATLCYPSSPAYFHWVVESLPRLRLLEPHLDALDGVFVPAAMEPAMRESLSLMGLRPEQLIGLDQASHYQPEQLLVPGYCAGLNLPQWVPGYLRGKVLGARERAGPGRRVYVSRNDADKRRVLNEPELAAVLAVRGFEILQLRDLGFRAQAELFDSCEAIVAPHGAGLVNAVFCRPGTQLLELVPSPSVQPHVFHSVASASGCEYWYLAGTCEAAPAATPEVHRDFRVAPGQLAHTLDQMGIA